jgi:hypothetical protein
MAQKFSPLKLPTLQTQLTPKKGAAVAFTCKINHKRGSVTDTLSLPPLLLTSALKYATLVGKVEGLE